MKCKFENCVFNNTEACQLRNVELDETGTCIRRLLLNTEQLELIIHKFSNAGDPTEVKAVKAINASKPANKKDAQETAELKETLTELYTTQGISISKIADKLHMSQSAIQRLIKKFSIQKKPS